MADAGRSPNKGGQCRNFGWIASCYPFSGNRWEGGAEVCVGRRYGRMEATSFSDRSLNHDNRNQSGSSLGTATNEEDYLKAAKGSSYPRFYSTEVFANES